MTADTFVRAVKIILQLTFWNQHIMRNMFKIHSVHHSISFQICDFDPPSRPNYDDHVEQNIQNPVLCTSIYINTKIVLYKFYNAIEIYFTQYTYLHISTFCPNPRLRQRIHIIQCDVHIIHVIYVHIAVKSFPM